VHGAHVHAHQRSRSDLSQRRGRHRRDGPVDRRDRTGQRAARDRGQRLPDPHGRQPRPADGRDVQAAGGRQRGQSEHALLPEPGRSAAIQRDDRGTRRVSGAAQAGMPSTSPSAAETPSVATMPQRNRKTSTSATTAIAAARQSKLAHSGMYRRSAPLSTVATRANRTWSTNEAVRLAITPTTAAVTPASPPLSAGERCSRSIHGANVNIHRKQGAKVTQVVRPAPSSPATNGLNGS